MRRKESWALTALVLGLLTGCNGGVNTVGDTPEQAAEEAAAEICMRAGSCGAVTVSCMSEGSGTTCSGTIEEVTPVDEAECNANLSSGLVTAFEQADAAGIARSDLDACINATIAQPCISQAELDAYLARREAGEMDVEIREPPPQCAALGITFGG